MTKNTWYLFKVETKTSHKKSALGEDLKIKYLVYGDPNLIGISHEDISLFAKKIAEFIREGRLELKFGLPPGYNSRIEFQPGEEADKISLILEPSDDEKRIIMNAIAEQVSKKH